MNASAMAGEFNTAEDKNKTNYGPFTGKESRDGQ